MNVLWEPIEFAEWKRNNQRFLKDENCPGCNGLGCDAYNWGKSDEGRLRSLYEHQKQKDLELVGRIREKLVPEVL